MIDEQTLNKEYRMVGVSSVAGTNLCFFVYHHHKELKVAIVPSNIDQEKDLIEKIATIGRDDFDRKIRAEAKKYHMLDSYDQYNAAHYLACADICKIIQKSS